MPIVGTLFSGHRGGGKNCARITSVWMVNWRRRQLRPLCYTSKKTPSPKWTWPVAQTRISGSQAKKRVPLSVRPLVRRTFISGGGGGKIPHSLTRWAMELFSTVDGQRMGLATPQLFEACNWIWGIPAGRLTLEAEIEGTKWLPIGNFFTRALRS